MEGKAIYFLDFGDFYKIGITGNPRQRIETLIRTNSHFNVEHFANCFYYELSYSAAFTLEKALKNKYEPIEIEGMSKTECFPSEFMEDMESDLIGFLENFNFDFVKRYMIEKFVVLEDPDTGNLSVKATGQLWGMYKLFKKHEKTFDKMFGHLEV